MNRLTTWAVLFFSFFLLHSISSQEASAPENPSLKTVLFPRIHLWSYSDYRQEFYIRNPRHRKTPVFVSKQSLLRSESILSFSGYPHPSLFLDFGLRFYSGSFPFYAVNPDGSIQTNLKTGIPDFFKNLLLPFGDFQDINRTVDVLNHFFLQYEAPRSYFSFSFAFNKQKLPAVPPLFYTMVQERESSRGVFRIASLGSVPIPGTSLGFRYLLAPNALSGPGFYGLTALDWLGGSLQFLYTLRLSPYFDPKKFDLSEGKQVFNLGFYHDFDQMNQTSVPTNISKKVLLEGFITLDKTLLSSSPSSAGESPAFFKNTALAGLFRWNWKTASFYAASELILRYQGAETDTVYGDNGALEKDRAKLRYRQIFGGNIWQLSLTAGVSSSSALQLQTEPIRFDFSPEFLLYFGSFLPYRSRLSVSAELPWVREPSPVPRTRFHPEEIKLNWDSSEIGGVLDAFSLSYRLRFRYNRLREKELLYNTFSGLWAFRNRISFLTGFIVRTSLSSLVQEPSPFGFYLGVGKIFIPVRGNSEFTLLARLNYGTDIWKTPTRNGNENILTADGNLESFGYDKGKDLFFLTLGLRVRL